MNDQTLFEQGDQKLLSLAEPILVVQLVFDPVRYALGAIAEIFLSEKALGNIAGR